MLWTRLHEAVPVDVPLRSTRKQREMMGSETPSTVRGGDDLSEYGDMYNRRDVEEAHRLRDRHGCRERPTIHWFPSHYQTWPPVIRDFIIITSTAIPHQLPTNLPISSISRYRTHLRTPCKEQNSHSSDLFHSLVLRIRSMELPHTPQNGSRAAGASCRLKY